MPSTSVMSKRSNAPVVVADRKAAATTIDVSALAEAVKEALAEVLAAKATAKVGEVSVEQSAVTEAETDDDATSSAHDVAAAIRRRVLLAADATTALSAEGWKSYHNFLQSATAEQLNNWFKDGAFNPVTKTFVPWSAETLELMQGLGFKCVYMTRAGEDLSAEMQIGGFLLFLYQNRTNTALTVALMKKKLPPATIQKLKNCVTKDVEAHMKAR